jgi:hypothetical protein
MMGERTWYKQAFDILGVNHDNGLNRQIVTKHHHDGHPNHPLVKQGLPPYPAKQLIVCTNWDKVHEIWTSQEQDRPGKLWKFLPKGFIKSASRGHTGVIDEVIGENGSLLKFMSVDAYKKQPLSAESSDWDRCSLDEPAPNGLWKAVARGLVDRHGQGDFTLTSLEELWIYEYFNLDELPADAPDTVKDRFSVRATMFDNPYLSDNAIIAYQAELNEDEIQCRIHGVPLELSGLIYKEFKKPEHVLTTLPEGWRDWHLPAKDLILYIRADTHPVRPHAVSFFVVGPSDIPVQIHEIYMGCDADTLAESINAYVASTGLFLGGFKLEPAAWIKDPSNRTVSIAKVLAKHGLYPRPGSKDLSGGILAVRSALKRKRILFVPTLKRTFWEIARYRYDPKTGKPIDEDDHMMENLYRLVIDNVKWFNPDEANYAIEDEEFTQETLSDVSKY